MTYRALIMGVAALLAIVSPAMSQTLQPTTTTPDTIPRVEVFVGGNIRNILSQKEAGNENVAGSLGLRYRGRQYAVSALINLGGSADTVKTGFGATLLHLSSGPALNAGLLDIRKPRIHHSRSCTTNPEQIVCHVGFHAYVSASTARWIDTLDTMAVPGVVNVPSVGMGVALSYSFVNGTIRVGEDDKKVAMVLDVGWATRHLRGDLVSLDSLRSELLQSDKRDFNGLEIGLTLQFDLLTAGINYYNFGGSIKGLSKGQLVAGAGIQTNFTSGSYN